MSNWQQITIRSQAAANAEIISDCLSELGAAAVTFQDAGDDPLYEPDIGSTPLWDNTLIQGLFTADTDMGLLLKQLDKQFVSLQWSYTLETIAEADWQNTWQQDFKPQCFANRLWVVPSWHEPPEPQAINLRLDPGLAFGTGSHATTQLCLEWLAQHEFKQQTVIDYGCGSGILAIAALKLGAKSVIAVDIDPQALQATRSNAENNGIIKDHLQTIFPTKLPPIKADILIANILAKPLIELASYFAHLCKPQAQLVLSGILERQAPSVIEAYQPWFDFEPTVQQDGWILLHAHRSA